MSKKPNDIKILQNKILEIMVYIDEICKKNEIDYYLMGGSALGAIRHKGFIPWDDDMDIFMTPNNYKKFKKIFQKSGDKEKFYLQEMCSHNEMITSAKLRANGTAFIEEAYEHLDIHQGIFVDIFILHNCPNSFIKQLHQCLCAKYITMRKIGMTMKYVKLSKSKKVVASILNMLPHNFLILHCLKQLYKHDNNETKYVCHFVGHAFMKKGIYEKELFGKGKYVDFENTQLKVPEKVETYLTERWGNYMQLPPIEKRKVVQHAKLWSTKDDFKKYCKNIKKYSDEKYLY